MVSDERILTTHAGSLPRPQELASPGDPGYEASLRDAVHDVVARQVELGIDIVSDGEFSKPGYANYIVERASGFGGQGTVFTPRLEAVDFPDWGTANFALASEVMASPACVGEVQRTDHESVPRDVANLKAACEAAGAREAFLTAASPGVLAQFQENQYYPTHQAYLEALAAAMQEEYEQIHEGGLVVQVDCPDLAGSRHVRFPDMELDEWKKTIEGHVDVINAATANIPPEAMRIHVCWGNYEGPHHHDVPLREIIEIVLRARPAMISFEAANPRHEHEWQVFEDVKLPEGKVLLPGVVDSQTNYVEHPELVAQRIKRFADLVGRENVIAATDCGYATFTNSVPVFPTVAYAKLRSLVEGAEIASRQLWSPRVPA